jgi:predicted RNase H-like nuclease (RuvC/YqgF family)
MINNETQIVETASEYSLKYDEKSEGLRDKTYLELVKEYGSKIKCPCTNKIYSVTSQSIKSHFNSQKHENWVIKNQKEHIENYGHCCCPQDIVNIQNKELRNLKCIVHDLTNKNKILVQENTKLEEYNKNFQDKIELLKSKITQLEEEEKFVDCD